MHWCYYCTVINLVTLLYDGKEADVELITVILVVLLFTLLLLLLVCLVMIDLQLHWLTVIHLIVIVVQCDWWALFWWCCCCWWLLYCPTLSVQWWEWWWCCDMEVTMEFWWQWCWCEWKVHWVMCDPCIWRPCCCCYCTFYVLMEVICSLFIPRYILPVPQYYCYSILFPIIPLFLLPQFVLPHSTCTVSCDSLFCLVIFTGPHTPVSCVPCSEFRFWIHAFLHHVLRTPLHHVLGYRFALFTFLLFAMPILALLPTVVGIRSATCSLQFFWIYRLRSNLQFCISISTQVLLYHIPTFYLLVSHWFRYNSYAFGWWVPLRSATTVLPRSHSVTPARCLGGCHAVCIPILQVPGFCRFPDIPRTILFSQFSRHHYLLHFLQMRVPFALFLLVTFPTFRLLPPPAVTTLGWFFHLIYCVYITVPGISCICIHTLDTTTLVCYICSTWL